MYGAEPLTYGTAAFLRTEPLTYGTAAFLSQTC